MDGTYSTRLPYRMYSTLPRKCPSQRYSNSFFYRLLRYQYHKAQGTAPTQCHHSAVMSQSLTSLLKILLVRCSIRYLAILHTIIALFEGYLCGKLSLRPNTVIGKIGTQHFSCLTRIKACHPLCKLNKHVARTTAILKNFVSIYANGSMTLCIRCLFRMKCLSDAVGVWSLLRIKQHTQHLSVSPLFHNHVEK